MILPETMKKPQERVLSRRRLHLKKLLERKMLQPVTSVLESRLLFQLPVVLTSIAPRSERYSTTPGLECRSTTKEGGSTGTPLMSHSTLISPVRRRHGLII